MSFDSDLDYYGWLNGPDDTEALAPNATCTDCGDDYAKAADDPMTWCEACAEKRSRWADALDARSQAKATLQRPRRRARA